ncbi:hypothetical protein [Tenacibaculum halocynthiae]|uniref:hypothetical protein n=1 Tax=Tenacibaculum halocynthiae TaxID=1254437 RepID=UPI0038945A0A
MKSRTLLFVGAGIALVSLTSFTIKKKAQIEKVIDKLQFKISSVKNLRLSFKEIGVDIGIQLINPTSEDLTINTGFIKAKVIRVYEKSSGKLLAFSNLNTHKIDLPSGGSFDLPPAHIKIPIITGAQLLLSELKKNNKEAIAKKLAFELDITGLGFTKTIKF